MTLEEQSNALLTSEMGVSEGRLILSERTIETLETIYKKTNAKNVLEIGFNAGHSSFGVMSLIDDVTYHSIDICQYPHTEVCASKLTDMFPERFKFTKLDSKDLDIDAMSVYDMVFIDGDHRPGPAALDVQKCNQAGVEWILIDDYEYIWFPQLTKLINHYINSSRFPYVLDSIHEYDCVDGWKGVGKMVLLKRDSK
jgi:hypothetical protein